jgi:hypothetical protein
MPCASYLVTAAGRHIVAAFCKLILSLSRALSASILSLSLFEREFSKCDAPGGVEGLIDSQPDTSHSKRVLARTGLYR